MERIQYRLVLQTIVDAMDANCLLGVPSPNKGNGNSSALAIGLSQYCTNPLICDHDILSVNHSPLIETLLWYWLVVASVNPVVLDKGAAVVTGKYSYLFYIVIIYEYCIKCSVGG